MNQEILTAINTIKSQVQGLDNNKLTYEIWGLMPNISQEMQLLNKGDNKEEKCYDNFCKELDALTNNTSVAKAKVILRNGRNQTIGNSEITFKQQYFNTAESHSENTNRRSNERQHTSFTNKRNNRNHDYNRNDDYNDGFNNNCNHDHNHNSYENDNNNYHHTRNNNNQNPNYNNSNNQNYNNHGFNNQNFSGFLQLMGFDLGGLNGTTNSNDNLGGLEAVLAVRDKMKDDQYLKEREKESYKKLLTDNAKLETELIHTKQQLEQAHETIEELEDDLEQAEKENQELEKLNPQNSLLGVSMTGLGINVLHGLIKKNAGVIGGLMGVDGNTFLGMIETNENEEFSNAQQQDTNSKSKTSNADSTSSSNVESVEIEEVDDAKNPINLQRKQANKAIITFCNSLSEDLFIELYKLLTSFAQNPQSILFHRKWEVEKQTLDDEKEN